MKVEGYFAKFAVRSEDLGGFVERIDPHAFDSTLRHAQEAPAILCLLQHDPIHVLGRVGAGTLTLRTDATGLWGAVDLSDVDPVAVHVAEALRRGDLHQASFAFRTRVDDWTVDRSVLTRTLLDVELLEVTICAFPAYRQTEIRPATITAPARTRTAGSEARMVTDRLRLDLDVA